MEKAMAVLVTYINAVRQPRLSNLMLHFGLLLTILGCLAYLFSAVRSNGSAIAAAVGILMALCGFVAEEEKQNASKAMMAAVFAALFGFFGTFPDLLMLLTGTVPYNTFTILVEAITALLSLAFLLYMLRDYVTSLLDNRAKALGHHGHASSH